MRNFLLILTFICSLVGFAQAPTIEGDLMLCPYTNGTAEITNNQTYETYQWYYKYWFLNGEYEAIDGATSASFTYDWMTYDQALLKVVVTLNGQEYESNTLQIDSYAWAGLLVESNWTENEVYVHPDNGHFMMCPGSSITNSVGSPYISFQWYKDGEAIEGATESTYVFTEPGAYRVVASPDVCPDSTTTGPEMIVELRDDCTAGTENPELKNSITLYPNPASGVLNVQLGNNVSAEGYTIYDVTGKQLTTGSLNGNLSSINIEALAAGSYLIKVNGANGQATKLFVKQ